MALPSPLPDNPKRWEGWRTYNSENPYERLCLSFESNPSDYQIEDHCRQLLVWWQKKLPLKNQPSNPLTQMLRAGLDEAARYLAEARTQLLDPEFRAKLDEQLRAQIRESSVSEFLKFFSFAVSDGILKKDDEANLLKLGQQSGLAEADIHAIIIAELEKRSAKREEDIPVPPPPEPAAPAGGENGQQTAHDPFSDFKRMLRLTGLDSDEMTDDQRDALCNMGENLGLTGGQAEDLIDEYLDEVSGLPPLPSPGANRPAVPLKPPTAAPPKPAAVKPQQKETPKKDAAGQSRPAEKAAPSEPPMVFTPLARVQEKKKYPNFKNLFEMEMLLIQSGMYYMGSNSHEAGPNEQPVSRTQISCFYMARFPVTNAVYEQFDPKHASKRAAWADGNHPVIYVTSIDAMNFCQWLSAQEKRKYRLPTEAEWEYAARGMDGRNYPWGDRLDSGDMANFADKRTNFAWKDTMIDDGWAETSPVGAYPRGASAFGIEDMAGNVWEWCLDFFEPYKGKERVDPCGPTSGSKRIYRGGSWKSRPASLRATTRNFNMPDYSTNDVGFRVVCECE